MNESSRVKGVVVDAGHGGSDPGAVADGYQEKDYNLKAARYMYDRLQQLGIPATLTRSGDQSISNEERISTMVNSFGRTPDVLVLSNHVNAGGGEGAEVYYPLRSDGVLAEQILDELAKAGQIPRGTFQRTLPEDPSRDYYYIQRLTPDTTALLLEYGYIDNPTDREKLNRDLLRYVEAVVKAVADYAGVPYTPPSFESGNTYIVQAGDSLWTIANRYGISVGALRSANNLASDLLQIGQVLIIPTPTGPTTPMENTYIVQAGDSLYTIANRFGITVEELKNANQLVDNIIYIGQNLIIPEQASTPSMRTYTVQVGDSLWSIASRFGTTVDTLRLLNHLTSDAIYPGDILELPSTTSNPNRIYVVQPGDSLWSIANRYGVTIPDLVRENGLTTTMLSVGQVLKIPVIY